MTDAQLAGVRFERILLVKPSSLGDIVHALPVLHGLRVRFPSAVIDWLVATPFAPLLEGHSELNETILFDRRRFGRMGRSPRVAGDFFRFIRHLRTRRYDLVIDLQGLFRTGFLSWISGARVRIGFAKAREGAAMFYTHRMRVADPNTHAVDRNYLAARLLGFEHVPIEFRLEFDAAVRAQAETLLRDEHVAQGVPIVLVVPGARWETKVWLPDRFAQTIDALHSDGSARCVLVGGPDEAALCERIAMLARTSPMNLAGRTSVRQLAAMISQADVVLCHDSAASHLAVALRRAVVCLIGPTNPSRTGPYGRLQDVIRLDLDCAPCYLRTLAQCPHDHRCMKELGVAIVVSAVRDALSAAQTEAQESR